MKKYKVKLIFSTPKKWKLFSHLIKWRLGTEYSHVAVMVYLEPLDFWDVYEAAYGDVHLIGEVKFKQKNNIIREFDLELDRQEFMDSLKWLKHQLEKSYSEIGALASTFRKLKKWQWGDDDDKSFMCSELAARYLEATGKVNLDYNADYITPLMFEQLLDKFYHNNVYFHED